MIKTFLSNLWKWFNARQIFFVLYQELLKLIFEVKKNQHCVRQTLASSFPWYLMFYHIWRWDSCKEKHKGVIALPTLTLKLFQENICISCTQGKVFLFLESTHPPRPRSSIFDRILNRLMHISQNTSSWKHGVIFASPNTSWSTQFCAWYVLISRYLES